MISAKRILIVDDEPNVRLVFRTALESSGYTVVEAGDGGAALARLRKSTADLILLDLKLPKVDGLQVLRQLKSDDRLKLIPVVMLTSSNEEKDGVRS